MRHCKRKYRRIHVHAYINILHRSAHSTEDSFVLFYFFVFSQVFFADIGRKLFCSFLLVFFGAFFSLLTFFDHIIFGCEAVIDDFF